jgi:hypothetical protein
MNDEVYFTFPVFVCFLRLPFLTDWQGLQNNVLIAVVIVGFLILLLISKGKFLTVSPETVGLCFLIRFRKFLSISSLLKVFKKCLNGLSVVVHIYNLNILRQPGLWSKVLSQKITSQMAVELEQESLLDISDDY